MINFKVLRHLSKYIQLVFILLAYNASSQNETKFWYFGNKAGIDFNSSPPTVLTNGVMNASEGCATISDYNGNLLFYTDGLTLWNKTHNVMVNGNGLFADISSTQSSIIVKQPGNSSIYYVFTQGSPTGTLAGLYYSIVDMNLSGGYGSVTVKNTTIFTTGTEKLAAVKHANGTDFWILSHDWNNNIFRANLLTSQGLSTTIVTSTIGSIYSNSDFAGQLKISPDGKKVGAALYTSSFELYDFNTATGVVFNPLLLSNNLIAAYGCEFSSDSKKFYGGTNNNDSIYQWDLCSKSNSLILASKQVIGTSTIQVPCAMQLAPNGKIYFARINLPVIGAIHNPNNAGIACNYDDLALTITTGTSNFGLPSFVSSYFYPGPTLTVNTIGNFSMCSGESKTLVVSGASTYTWNGNYVSSTIAITPIITSTYTVVGTTSTGCLFDEAATVSVSACLGLQGLQMAEYKFQIWPNPADNVLVTEALEATTDLIKIQIYNNLGQLIKEEDLHFKNKKAEIRTADLPNGVYLLLFKNSNSETSSKRFVINR